jgi:hypothetical protein
MFDDEPAGFRLPVLQGGRRLYESRAGLEGLYMVTTT